MIVGFMEVFYALYLFYVDGLCLIIWKITFSIQNCLMNGVDSFSGLESVFKHGDFQPACVLFCLSVPPGVQYRKETLMMGLT